MHIPASPIKDGRIALAFLVLAALLSGVEALLVQTQSVFHQCSWDLVKEMASPALLSLDFLMPLAVALLSRRAFLVFSVLQSLLGAVILHYGSFFYNTLTLSTIYHSLQGLSYLGGSIFDFVRLNVVAELAAVGVAKLLLLWLSSAPEVAMPGLWRLRGAMALSCFMAVSLLLFFGHGRTGILSLWAGRGEHRTAEQRRSQEGTEAAVRQMGYLSTWLGEWVSGVYKDTSLIYTPKRCADPQAAFLKRHPQAEDLWDGHPLPPPSLPLVMIQVESLDYAMLSMRFGEELAMPFLHELCRSSLLLKAFAPHKVGSANSDYELLNSRVADQNVMYYSYICHYPDSVIHSISGLNPAAFHGLEGSLFHLRDAYAKMGFARTFFKEELRKAGYEASQLTMEHVADADVLDAAARYLEEGRGKAVFIITMSSHIPFMDPVPGFAHKGMFARYAASLRYVDECLAAFYQRLPQGSVFVLWGDHSSDIPYPPEEGANGKHVPFLVNVKGHDAWLGALPRQGAQVYSLCELSYFLRRILEGEGALGREAQPVPGERQEAQREAFSSHGRKTESPMQIRRSRL